MAEVAAIVFIVALVAVAFWLVLRAVDLHREDVRRLRAAEVRADEAGNTFSESTATQTIETPRHVAAVDRLVDEVERDLRENPGSWELAMWVNPDGLPRPTGLAALETWHRRLGDLVVRVRDPWEFNRGLAAQLYLGDQRVPLYSEQRERLSAALESGPITLARETKETEEADLFNHAAEALAEAPSEIVAKSDVVVRKPGDRPRIATLTCNSNGIWSGVWKFGEGVVGDDFTIKTPRKSPRKASKKTAGKA